MTQKEKALVIKDLSMRLPYGVICNVTHKDGRWKTEDMKLSGVFNEDSQYFTCESGSAYSSTFKPYLCPMSSMTKEERLVYEQRLHDVGRSIDVIDTDDVVSHIDWLLAHHFDFRGLISKGLALEAPPGMYKTE